ncbi:MAG: phytanoyl-CoA dioxygenase family protein [Pseudomonadota bacterium]
MIDDSLVARFQQDGYVVIPDLLTADELDHYEAEVTAAVSSRKQFDRRSLAEKSTYEQSFIQCMNLWEDFPGVRPLTFHPRIAEAAALLLGVPRVRLWHDQALFKEPGGRVTDPHQDLPYWAMAETDALTAWIPLGGATRENGCLGYVPGSHRLGIRQLVDIFRGSEQELAEQAEALLVADPVFVEVPRGAVAFHHGLTAHQAMPNTTARTRAVHTMIFFRDGMTRHATNAHYCVDRAGIKPGEVIKSAATPIAWPREPGDLPAPPAPLTYPEKIMRTGTFPLSNETST